MPPKRTIHILLIEDNEDDAQVMMMELEHANGFNIEYQRVEDEAGMLIALHKFPVEIVISDYKMPRFDPFRAMQILKELDVDAPFVLVSGVVSEEEANQMIRKGVKDYVYKGVIAKIIPVIENLFELFISRDALIEVMSKAIEFKDWETAGHSERVTGLTVQLARRMDVSETEIMHIQRGALLHDIGKIWISDSILLKRGVLTPGERLEMQRHPQIAFELFKSVPFLRKALAVPHYHHEKWDGTGYPSNLEGIKIPLAARIFAVADNYDALISDRPYRRAISSAEALEYIREQAGKHFDPAVVEAFLGVMRERE